VVEDPIEALRKKLDEPRPRQNTLLDGSPPPADPPPRSISPTPWESPAALERIQRNANAHGEAVVEAPKSAPARLVYLEPAWWRSAGGVAKVVGAVVGGIVASTASFVAIINAMRAPTDPQIRSDIDSLKVQVTGLRRYVEDSSEANKEEARRDLAKLRSKLTELDMRYPEPVKPERK